MTQNSLNRQVAKATGETVECIRHRGVTLLDLRESYPRKQYPRRLRRPYRLIRRKQSIRSGP